MSPVLPPPAAPASPSNPGAAPRAEPGAAGRRRRVRRHLRLFFAGELPLRHSRGLQPYLPVVRVFALILFFFGATLLLPLLVAWGLDDGAGSALGTSLALTLGSSALLLLATRRATGDLSIRDGFLLVVLTWAVLPVFAALPLMLQLGTSFTDAYFEAASGLTTTCATVLTGLDVLPPSINLWRCQLAWVGGMGLIVLAVAILPLLGIGGRQMFKAETPGPMKERNLTPRIAETAKGLWGVYVLLTALCVGAYRWAGMTWLDAVMHGFSTLGLGGYSSHDASYGYWNSPAIEAVAVVFMLVAGLNFATHYLALRRLSLRAYRNDPEAGWFLWLMLGSVAGITVYLVSLGVYPDPASAFRHAAFNVVSVATTTGFATTDYGQWPPFATLWMLFLSSFATCAGSTGGGIKMIRAVILYQQVKREILRALYPSAVVPVRLAGAPVPSPILFAVLAFAFMYMASTALLTMILVGVGLEPLTAFSAVVAMINNTGPGLNEIGPAGNFAGLTDLQTWICSFTMLLGRLEIFTLLVVFSPAFWRR